MSRARAKLEELAPSSPTGREAEEARKRRPTTLGELATAGCQLAALSAFAFAQPLFDLLSRNAEFFAVRGSTSTDIVLFALSLVLLPPIALVTIEGVAGLIDRRLRQGLHLVFVGGFVGLFAAQALKEVEGLGSLPIMTGTVLIAAVAVGAYSRTRAVQRLLTVLAPASLLFLALFLFFSPVTKLIFPPNPKVASGSAVSLSEAPPIVFVVFDEFPVTAIMTGDGEIDSVRYPNLAAFARRASWFRNATTVSYETVKAVPALLTGMFPKDDSLPVFEEHPRNLFTLLRGTYRLNIHETRTHLCDGDVCEGRAARDSLTGRIKSLVSDTGVLYAHMVAPPVYEQRLPVVTTTWGDFLSGEQEEPGATGSGKLAEWKTFLASVRATSRPALNAIHLMLPHEPWKFLSSCRSNVFRLVRRHTPGLPPGAQRWQDDEWLVTQAHQRLLLQTQCVDALVGQLIRRLRQLGLYDRSLVILASDHGVSVRPGEWRRQIDVESPTNLADIAFPVLLVKRPGQQRGEIIDEHVETIDVLPTISEIAGVPMPWRVDGRPLWDERNEPPQVRVLTEGGLVTASLSRLARERDTLVQRQIAHFGERDDHPGLFGIGPHRELIGERVGDIETGAPTGLTATIVGEVKKLLADFPDGSAVVPTPIYGSLEGDGAERRFAIAIAVNGRIAAVAWTDGHGSRTYSALVPEDSFRPGRNRVEVFAVRERVDGVVLTRLS